MYCCCCRRIGGSGRGVGLVVEERMGDAAVEEVAVGCRWWEMIAEDDWRKC